MKIENHITLKENKFISFSSMELKIDASAFYPTLEPYYNQGDIPFIRVADIREEINYENCVRIPKMSANYNTLKICTKGDIVLTKGGTIGKAGLIECESYVTRDLIFINSSILSKVDYTALFLLFSTSFMYQQMIKSSSYSVQPHLTINLIKELLVYNFDLSFKEIVFDLYNKHKQLKTKSKSLYTEAENLLLSELGLLNYTPTNKAVSIKSFANSFSASGRLDAEYYQPKYEEIVRIISSVKHKNLVELVNITKSIEPGSVCYGNEGIPFIRISNLTKFGITDPDIKIPYDTVTSMEKLYPKKDTILLTKDGSVGIAYKLEEDMNCVTSGALLHLKVVDEKEILADYLTLLLNSLIVQMQAERDAGGSIIQHWKPSEIEQVVVPLLPMVIQKQISKKIQQSFALRKQSTILLENAKLAVEMAIEQGEDVAMKWLEGVLI